MEKKREELERLLFRFGKARRRAYSMKQKGKRVMALDVNAGHIDFAVMEKENFEVVSVGRVEIHETQYVRRGKREGIGWT
ncbi:MAG: hypothetical protein ACXQTS_01465 [Candidatus Methanospirareceae archaeon]